jgi:hypothetical protein
MPKRRKKKPILPPSQSPLARGPAAAADDFGRLLPMAHVREVLMCSRQKIYQLFQDGHLDLVKLGGQTRVTDTSLRTLIAKLPRPQIKGQYHTKAKTKLVNP